MANTYQLIASSVLTTTTASVTFSSIPQTYSDLVVRMIARTNTADTNVNVYLRVNNDSTTNYSSTSMSFYGSSQNYNQNINRSQLDNGPWASGANLDANGFASNTVYIANYTNSLDKQISVFGGLFNQSTSQAWAIDESGLYRGTSPITSIQLPPYSGSYVAGSSFYLYGLASS